MNDHTAAIPLDRMLVGESCSVVEVAAVLHAPEWAQRLEEIGFIPGERVTLMTRAALGGDPLVVRVGISTFALRRAEAACVRVRPLRGEHR